MKIVHIAENYIEGWGYQENLLPLYQRRAGNDVVVVSDNNHLSYVQNQQLAEKIKQKGKEYEYDGMKVYKINTYLNTSSTSFFCYGLWSILKKERPDIIFHHNVNTSTLSVAAWYKKSHPNVKLYADNHVDWINESKNMVWHKIFYDTIIPCQVRMIQKYVDYFIGVSPLRCQYLNKVFKVPEGKIRFLPIGCDTDGASLVSDRRSQLRQMCGIKEESFVVISGGKLDRSKGVLPLIMACNALRESIANLHLVLFGKIDEEISDMAKGKEWITLFGWCDRKETLSLLKMADVACWPWLHTTLIEDSIAVATPIVVKMSDNVSHFANQDAGIFMDRGDREELMNALLKIKDYSEYYRQNALVAQNKFSYSTLIQQLDNEQFYLF